MPLTVIHQPDFIPYIGFFHRLRHSANFVVLDHVQFVKSNQSWTHRDKIKTKNGEKWITISVKKIQRFTRINDVFISNEVNWKQKHLNLIYENYKSTDFFDEIFPEIEDLYSLNTNKLYEFNMKFIEWILDIFGIKINIFFSSKLDPKGTKNDLLVDILNKIDAKNYLSGLGAKNYFESKPFLENCIKVHWQKFNHPVYKQNFDGFIKNLSIIDLLLNCGKKKSINLMNEL